MKKYKFITIRQINIDPSIISNGKDIFIKFNKSKIHEQPELFNGKPVYRIFNNRSGDQLGILSYYTPWRQYVFSSQPECVFNKSCLLDILDFMNNEIGK